MLTRAILDGLDVLGPGLGLGALRLILLPSPGSPLAPRAPVVAPVNMLLGRAGFRPGAAAAALDDGRGGCASTVTVVGRTNMPWPMGHSKYLSPCTLPSFLPVSSSSSTPTQSPAANRVWPTKRMMPFRPSLRRMVCPAASSVMMVSGPGLRRFGHVAWAL